MGTSGGGSSWCVRGWLGIESLGSGECSLPEAVAIFRFMMSQGSPEVIYRCIFQLKHQLFSQKYLQSIKASFGKFLAVDYSCRVNEHTQYKTVFRHLETLGTIKRSVHGLIPTEGIFVLFLDYF